MTRRFFYTDPLAAAWMAKHFGIKFISALELFRDDRWIVSNEIIGGVWYESKSYIHPDSLHLLEPRVDDAVEFDRWFFERRRDAEYKDYPYQAHYAKVNTFGMHDQALAITSAGVCWDDTSAAPGFTLPFKIILRNGIPFMWPESEDA